MRNLKIWNEFNKYKQLIHIPARFMWGPYPSSAFVKGSQENLAEVAQAKKLRKRQAQQFICKIHSVNHFPCDARKTHQTRVNIPIFGKIDPLLVMWGWVLCLNYWIRAECCAFFSILVRFGISKFTTLIPALIRNYSIPFFSMKIP